MVWLVFGFLGIDVLLQHLPKVLSFDTLFFLSLPLLLAFLLPKAAWRYFIVGLLVGLWITTWSLHSLLAYTLPKKSENRPLLLKGYIASLPQQAPHQVRFLLARVDKPRVVFQLTWRDPSVIPKVGEKWQLRVKLKRIHGLQNAGGFDQEAWSLQKGIRGSGYVMGSPENHRLAHSQGRYRVNQFREKLQDRLMLLLPANRVTPWLMALMTGERNGVPPEDWEVLRKTGTNHLMVVAGLHIGLLALFIHILISFLWRQSSFLMLASPTPIAAVSAAWIGVMIYGLCAGFSLPTQRATIMFSLYALTVILRRKASAWEVWATALLVVLVINPLDVLSESLWLSFGTIALIIYGMSGRLRPTGWWWKWGRVQWLIAVGLIPLSTLFFQDISLISVVVNCLAIPWLGFLVLPFCFAGMLFAFLMPALSQASLYIASQSLNLLWQGLTFCASLPLSTISYAFPDTLSFCLLTIACLLILLPKGTPGKWFAGIFCLPLIYYQPLAPKPGEMWLTVLEVGQGLATVLQTHSHTLIYDTGPKFSPTMDTGERVILPFLRKMHLRKIDMLVISHGDNDHIGGTNALLNNLTIKQIKTSVPAKLPFPITSLCLAGTSWEWDGVHFTFIYPDHTHLHLGNDSSCVLRVDNGKQAILFTGDIEKVAEKMLLTSAVTLLPSDILIAPHHGSKTSGLRNFIEAIHPKYVVYSTGYLNRYHFPHPSVVKTYHSLHVQQFNTIDTGMLFFTITPTQITSTSYRQTKGRLF